MCIAEQFMKDVESQCINGRWFAGRYDYNVIGDLRSLWGAEAEIGITIIHPVYVFKDGSKCLYNRDYQDWFLI